MVQWLFLAKEASEDKGTMDMGQWLGDCAGTSGFCFPNPLWICNKMTTCGEEEEGHRFPSEECA